MVGLLGSAAAQLVQLIALPALTSGNTSIGAGLAFVVLMVIQGFVVAAIGAMYTRWYVDLRARKEPLLSSSLT
jgi:nucleoside recognition membrane protein YjiH